MGGYDAMPLIGAAVVVIVGILILLKSGSKFAWLIIAAGTIWAYKEVRPVIQQSKTGTTTPEQTQRGYYKDPAKQ